MMIIIAATQCKGSPLIMCLFDTTVQSIFLKMKYCAISCSYEQILRLGVKVTFTFQQTVFNRTLSQRLSTSIVFSKVLYRSYIKHRHYEYNTKKLGLRYLYSAPVCFAHEGKYIQKYLVILIILIILNTFNTFIFIYI